MKLTLAIAGAVLLSSAAGASEIITYTYDAKGRLVRVQHSGGPVSGVDKQYSYDKADNRQQVSVGGASSGSGGSAGGGAGGGPLPGGGGQWGGEPHCVDLNGQSVPCG